MPRSQPHPSALFSLVPKNIRSQSVLEHPDNQPFLSYQKDGRLALDIGHIRSKAGHNTLAILGRGDVDICIPGSTISKTQCSFEINPDTDVVMFFDRSHGRTSQVWGETCFPFEFGRPRKVVVQRGLNTIVGMGGRGQDQVLFELQWHNSPDKTMERIRERITAPVLYEENPRFARTIDEANTILPSAMETRIHTPRSQQPKLRYAKIGNKLGAGQYGEVFKAVDVDSGILMAVKILHRKASPVSSVWKNVKREIEILSRISHPNIIGYISSNGWDSGGDVEILMELSKGNLASLIRQGYCVPLEELATTLFHDTLQAIDFLATEKIIHRDIKPENILFLPPGSQYTFQLGDFGLSNYQMSAKTMTGTPLYMAPEVFADKTQTSKIDVWSLYITMLWTLDVGGYRKASNYFASHQAAVDFAVCQAPSFPTLREMAETDPEHRASAAQLLVKYFDGQGLSTPRAQVPPMTSHARRISEGRTTQAPGMMAARPRTRGAIHRMKAMALRRHRRSGKNRPEGTMGDEDLVRVAA
ncbi:hypothetical protein CFIO01_02299 [Colletotrichum fioriniae PJ7]|uniref:non-specific serine/threonine protein kinase n=1 Tax=Colletotrichum fioriniae PJ7 TaxID=1445577 RepID=A0A010RC50_9PEZI|nr:hypothetical protein CFIO01_02299 [Colletotrichum fioriniae PJ7]